MDGDIKVGTVVPGEDIVLRFRVKLAHPAASEPPQVREVVKSTEGSGLTIMRATQVSADAASEEWLVVLGLDEKVPFGKEGTEVRTTLSFKSRRRDVEPRDVNVVVDVGKYARLTVEPLTAHFRSDRAYIADIGAVFSGSYRTIVLRIKNDGNTELEYRIDIGRSRGAATAPEPRSLKPGQERIEHVVLRFEQNNFQTEKIEGGFDIRWRTGQTEHSPMEWRYVGVATNRFKFVTLADRLRLGMVDVAAGLCFALCLALLLSGIASGYFVATTGAWLSRAIKLSAVPPSWGVVLFLAAVLTGPMWLLVTFLATVLRGRTPGMVFNDVYVVDRRYGVLLTLNSRFLARIIDKYKGLPGQPQDVFFRRGFWRVLRAVVTLLTMGGVLGLLAIPWSREGASLEDLLSGTRLVRFHRG